MSINVNSLVLDNVKNVKNESRDIVKENNFDSTNDNINNNNIKKVSTPPIIKREDLPKVLKGLEADYSYKGEILKKVVDYLENSNVYKYVPYLLTGVYKESTGDYKEILNISDTVNKLNNTVTHLTLAHNTCLHNEGVLAYTLSFEIPNKNLPYFLLMSKVQQKHEKEVTSIYENIAKEDNNLSLLGKLYRKNSYIEKNLKGMLLSKDSIITLLSTFATSIEGGIYTNSTMSEHGDLDNVSRIFKEVLHYKGSDLFKYVHYPFISNRADDNTLSYGIPILKRHDKVKLIETTTIDRIVSLITYLYQLDSVLEYKISVLEENSMLFDKSAKARLPQKKLGYFEDAELDLPMELVKILALDKLSTTKLASFIGVSELSDVTVSNILSKVMYLYGKVFRYTSIFYKYIKSAHKMVTSSFNNDLYELTESMADNNHVLTTYLINRYNCAINKCNAINVGVQSKTYYDNRIHTGLFISAKNVIDEALTCIQKDTDEQLPEHVVNFGYDMYLSVFSKLYNVPITYTKSFYTHARSIDYIDYNDISLINLATITRVYMARRNFVELIGTDTASLMKVYINAYDNYYLLQYGIMSAIDRCKNITQDYTALSATSGLRVRGSYTYSTETKEDMHFISSIVSRIINRLGDVFDIHNFAKINMFHTFSYNSNIISYLLKYLVNKESVTQWVKESILSNLKTKKLLEEHKENSKVEYIPYHILGSPDIMHVEGSKPIYTTYSTCRLNVGFRDEYQRFYDKYNLDTLYVDVRDDEFGRGNKERRQALIEELRLPLGITTIRLINKSTNSVLLIPVFMLTDYVNVYAMLPNSIKTINFLVELYGAGSAVPSITVSSDMLYSKVLTDLSSILFLSYFYISAGKEEFYINRSGLSGFSKAGTVDLELLINKQIGVKYDEDIKQYFNYNNLINSDKNNKFLLYMVNLNTKDIPSYGKSIKKNMGMYVKVMSELINKQIKQIK